MTRKNRMKFRLFIMKILTDFLKTLETGVDPCLACRHLLFSLLDPFNHATKEIEDICMQAIKKSR